jgi:hypothetical protein
MANTLRPPTFSLARHGDIGYVYRCDNPITFALILAYERLASPLAAFLVLIVFHAPVHVTRALPYLHRTSYQVGWHTCKTLQAIHWLLRANR